MDITMIASIATSILAPVLPYLLKGGEKAMEEAGKQVGSEAWGKAKALWAKLSPKVEEQPETLAAAEEAAQAPADENAQETLRARIAELLADDKDLAGEVETLVRNDYSSHATAKGERSFASTGEISRSQILAGSNISITGKGNIVGQNNYSSVTEINSARDEPPPTLAEFRALLAQLQTELRDAALDDKTRRSVDADLQAVAAEAEDSRPSLPIIESKLKGVESIVNRVSGRGESGMSLASLIQKAIEFAGRLFS